MILTLLRLALNAFHYGLRSRSDVSNTVLQILGRCNTTKSLLPKRPPLQTVASALTPQPLVTVRRRARGAILAIMIDLAELMDALAGEEHPSGGRWHVHRRAPLLLGSLAGNLDGLHEADLGMERHAYWLPTKSEISRAEGRGVKQRHRLSIPVALFFHLVHGLDFYRTTGMAVSDQV